MLKPMLIKCDLKSRKWIFQNCIVIDCDLTEHSQTIYWVFGTQKIIFQLLLKVKSSIFKFQNFSLPLKSAKNAENSDFSRFIGLCRIFYGSQKNFSELQN